MRAALGCIALVAGCRTDVTAIDDQRIGAVWPIAQLDTSFVGDTVVAPVPLFLTSTCPFLPFGDIDSMLRKMESIFTNGIDRIPESCGNIGNFDITWGSSNPSVIVKAGEAKQHVTVENDMQFARFASLATGAARMTFDPSLDYEQGVFYFHDIVVLPVPDRMDVPDVVSLAVGQSMTLAASVRTGTGPRVTTGAIVWGPANSIASIAAVDTVFGKTQSDGRIAASSRNTITVKGLAVGEMTLPVVFKKSVTVFNIPGVLAAPAILSKNVTVIVGGSVRIATNPPGSIDDLAKASIPLAVGGTRQYQLLDQNNGTIANSSIKWETSDPKIDSLNANGTAKCLTPGTAIIKGTRIGTTLSATASLQCVASNVLAPTISVSTNTLQIQAGQTASVTATVNNAAGTSPVQWVSKDPTIVSVSPANVAASSTGAATTFKGEKVGGPVEVVATYTANGVTVTQTVSVTVTAGPSGNVVVAMWLDPVVSEYTSNGGNFYRARLFDAQGNEVAAASDGGSITYASNDTTVIKIDASTGLATAKKRTSTGTTTLSATYSKSGQAVATAATPVTVNPDGTAGFAGSVQFSITGEVRRLRVGQVIQFSVLIRDQNGIQLLPGQVSLSVLYGPPLQITAVPSTGGFFYNMTATGLPTTSAITGIPNVVLIRATTSGASATVPIVIVP